MFRVVLLALVMFAVPMSAQERVPTAADSARARLASVRSDLRNLVVAQEAYFASNSRYAKTVAELAPLYQPSRGNTVRLVVAENNAWTAEAKRDDLVGSCTMWVGIAEEKRAKTAEKGLVGEEGAPICDPQPALTPATSPTTVVSSQSP